MVTASEKKANRLGLALYLFDSNLRIGAEEGT